MVERRFEESESIGGIFLLDERTNVVGRRFHIQVLRNNDDHA